MSGGNADDPEEADESDTNSKSWSDGGFLKVPVLVIWYFIVATVVLSQIGLTHPDIVTNNPLLSMMTLIKSGDTERLTLDPDTLAPVNPDTQERPHDPNYWIRSHFEAQGRADREIVAREILRKIASDWTVREYFIRSTEERCSVGTPNDLRNTEPPPVVHSDCESEEVRTVQEYILLFRIVDDEIQSLIENRQIDLSTHKVTPEILPRAFNPNDEGAKEHELHASSQTLISEWRNTHEEGERYQSLISTIITMIALGGLGSLMFMTNELVFRPDHSTLLAFSLRPLLGAVLAIAVFILDVGVHTLVSQAEIVEIREETIYILALGAGMLAERTYTTVRGGVGNFLEDWRTRLSGQSDKH